MKLIRLVTSDNGNFKSSFGNEMALKPFSKMALLNLTFQSDIGSIPGMEIFAGSTMIITGKIGNGMSVREIELVGETFSKGDFEKFRKRVEHELNTLPMLARGPDLSQQINISGSAFRIKAGGNGRMEIEFRYAPFVNPLHLQVGETGNNAIMDFDAGITQVDTDVAGKTELNKADTIPATTNRTNHISSTVPIAAGSSFLLCRVKDLIDNTSGLQDNGFGIGLSKTPLSSDNIEPGEDIPVTKRNFEISINTPTDNYMFINNAGTLTDSGLAPEVFALATEPDIDLHDVVGFELQNGLLELCVYQQAVGGTDGLRTVLASTIMNPDEVLYPYLYFRGAKAHCKLDMLNYTADPFIIADTPILEDLYLNDLGGMRNGFDAMLINGSSNVSKMVPCVDGGPTPSGSGARWIPSTLRAFEVAIPHNILNALGFSQFPVDSVVKHYFRRELNPFLGLRLPIRATTLPSKYDSDNFIVESVSIPLDSYDASDVTYPSSSVVFNKNMSNKGRRKNILMTIPENDNEDGLVEFETNTPIFIDINNAETINVKNMDFRIVRQDFSAIRQGNQSAIMTILIED